MCFVSTRWVLLSYVFLNIHAYLSVFFCIKILMVIEIVCPENKIVTETDQIYIGTYRHQSVHVFFFLSSRLCMPSLWPCCRKGTHIRSDANSNQHLVFLLVNQESRSLFDFDAMIWHASTFRRISNVFCLLIWWW